MGHLIGRLVKENLRGGYDRIEGELKKPGFVASLIIIRFGHDRHGIRSSAVWLASLRLRSS